MEDLKITDEDSSKLEQSKFPVARALKLRQTGQKTALGGSQSVEELAENKLIDKGSDHRQELEELGVWEQEFQVITCQLGQTPRSTFLMVFSPDRTLMASTHGDHAIYVTQTKTGKCLHSLKGHPRTPWCIEFHPSRKGILASGCLGGQVRIWDLHGGSALWATEYVIASITFHPVEKFLVIATCNEILFWDWEKEEPEVKICTRSFHEKVRYVQFDRLGHQLITAIANVNAVPDHQSARFGSADGSGPNGGDQSTPGGGRGGQGGVDDPDTPPTDPREERMARYERLMDRFFFARRRGVFGSWDDYRDRDNPELNTGGETLESPELQDNASPVRRYSMLLDTEEPDNPSAGSEGAASNPAAGSGRAAPYPTIYHRDMTRRMQATRSRDPHSRFSPLRRAHSATVIRLNGGSSGTRQRSRLRRVNTFREPEHDPQGFNVTGFRQELRQRMVAARRARRHALMAREPLDFSTRTSPSGGSDSSWARVSSTAGASVLAGTRLIDGTIRIPRAIYDERTTLSDRLLETVGPPERTRDMLTSIGSSSTSSPRVSSQIQPPATSITTRSQGTSSTSTGEVASEARRVNLLSLEDRMRRISRLAQTSGGAVTLTPRMVASTTSTHSTQSSSTTPTTQAIGISVASIASAMAAQESRNSVTPNSDQDHVQRVTISLGNSHNRIENINETSSPQSPVRGPIYSTQIMNDSVMYQRMLESFRQGEERRARAGVGGDTIVSSSGGSSVDGQPFGTRRRRSIDDYIVESYSVRHSSDQSRPVVISSHQEQPPMSTASARERLTNLFSRRLEVRLTNMAPTIVTHASPLNILHQQANNGANTGSAADSIMTSSSFGANSTGTADSLMVASSYGANSGRTADSVIVVTSSSPSNLGANSDHEEIIADTTLTPTQIVDRLPVITAVGLPPPSSRQSPLIHDDDRQSPMLSGGLVETDTADDDRLTPNRSVFSQEEMGSGSQNTLEGVLTDHSYSSIHESVEDIDSGVSGYARSPVSVAADVFSRVRNSQPTPAIVGNPSSLQESVISPLPYESRTGSWSPSPMDHHHAAATRSLHSRSPAPNRSPAPYDSPRSTLNRSPSRGGPLTTFADSELTALRSRIAAGVRMSRRATADAPLTGGMSERIGLFSSGSGYTNTTSSSSENLHQYPENPFTSRPPSSASEIEIELPSAVSHSSTAVSSPIPRPLTARGRYSVDVEGRSSSVEGHSDLRRSMSIDQGGGTTTPQPHPPTPADVTAVGMDEGFASDSSSSRPGSRLERPDSRLGGGGMAASSEANSRIVMNRRSVVRVTGLERTSVTRRNTLTRLLEEDLETVTRERAASALSAVTTSPVYSRMASPLSLPGRSPRGGGTGDFDLQDDEDPPVSAGSSVHLQVATGHHQHSPGTRRRQSTARSLTRSLSEGSSDGVQAEIRAEETNPPPELVALASVEDEIEISNSASVTGPVSGNVNILDEDSHEMHAEGDALDESSRLRVNPELSMYPTGARMSILDSDDDADMEQSLTEQRNLQQRLEERNLQQSLEERHNLEEQQQSLEESHSLADDQPRGRIVDVPLSAIQSLDHEDIIHPAQTDLNNEDSSNQVVANNSDNLSNTRTTNNDNFDYTNNMHFDNNSDMNNSDTNDISVNNAENPPIVNNAENLGMLDVENAPRLSILSRVSTARVSAPTSILFSDAPVPSSSILTSASSASLDLSNSCDSAKSSETQPGDKRSASVITSTSAANSLAAAQSSAAASVASSSTTDVPMDVASNSGETALASNSSLESSPTVVTASEAAIAASAAVTASTSSLARPDPVYPSRRQHGLDISILARHIEHMQSICRESLENLPQSRQRRQVIRLQGIRRMLEDLHRQIRNLQSTVDSAVASTSGADTSSTSTNTEPQPGPSSSVDNLNRLPPMTAPVRHSGIPSRLRLRRRSGTVRSDVIGTGAFSSAVTAGTNTPGGVLANRHRLTRAVSRLHATVRAMDLTYDLSRRASNTVSEHLTEASQSVLERHERNSQRQAQQAAAAAAVSTAQQQLAAASGSSSRSNGRQLRADDRPIHPDVLRTYEEIRESYQQEEREQIEDLVRRNYSNIDPELRESVMEHLGEDARRRLESSQASHAGSSQAASSSSILQAGQSTLEAMTVAASSSIFTSSPAASARSSSSRREFDIPELFDSPVTQTARDGLRSISQRLERLLRQRREANESAAVAAITADASRTVLDLTAGSSRSVQTSDSGDTLSTSRSTSAQRASTLRDSLASLLTPAGPGLSESSTPSDSEEESFLIDPNSSGSFLSDTSSHFLRNSPLRSSFGSSSRLRHRHRRVFPSDFSPLSGSSGLRGSSGIGDSSRSVDQGPGLSDGWLGSGTSASPRESHSLRNHMRRINNLRAVMELRLENRLPPLSNLILRRLHRRLQGSFPTLEAMAAEASDTERSAASRSYRQGIREIMDQLSIDQHEAENNLGLDTGLGGAGSGVHIPTYDPLGFRRVGSGSGLSAAMGSNPRSYSPASPFSRQDRVRLSRMRFTTSQRFNDRPRSTSSYSSNVTYRIQTWDFWGAGIPDICEVDKNIVVKEARIHNDACVDISQDGCQLVTLAPCNLPMTTIVGLYSLEKRNLGQVLATYSLESCAVSVSLSPTNRHLLVGLTSRIRPSSPNGQPPLMAQVFRIKLPGGGAGTSAGGAGDRGRLIHRKDIHQVEPGNMSLNCIRWIPIPGQGFVFATNTGLLKILR